jgi:hypothetical protein
VAMSKYCAVCGKQICENCPICGDLHSKQAQFCLKYGTNISSYLETAEKILRLIREFENSEKQLHRKKAASLGCLIGVAAFAFAIITGLITLVIYSIWQFTYRPLLIISLSIGITAIFYGLTRLAEEGKDTYRFDRIDYLKEHGIIDPYWIKTFTYTDDIFSMMKQKLEQGNFFKN